jgi:hypothetical protein
MAYEVFTAVNNFYSFLYYGEKSKANFVTGSGDPQGFETARLLYFPDNQFTDGIAIVSVTRRPPPNPRMIPCAYFR